MATASSTSSTTSSPATSTFMQIGNIQGNVTAAGHENWIHLDSLEFGVDRQFTTQPGEVSERESARPNFSSVKITKKLDSASPQLFLLACEGQQGQNVKIDLCKSGTSQISPFMEYTLSDVLVGQYNVKHDNSGKPYEELTLHYDKIQMAYKPSDQTNKAGNQIVAGYDLTTGQKC